MRRLVLATAAVCLTAAAPAAAAVETRIEATGGVLVTWKGDPARGCAEHGVCDLAGSVALDAEGDQGVSGTSGRRLDRSVSVNIDAEGGVVRVVRGDPRGPAGACTDTIGDEGEQLSFRAEAAAGGATRLVPSFESPSWGLSAGRCPGPVVEDLASALGPVALPHGALRRLSFPVDLRMRKPFVAGPFSGEVVSTLHAVVRRRVRHDPRLDRVSRAEPPVRRDRRAPRRAAARRVFVEVGYRVEAIDGLLGVDFAGVGEPGCSVLDACGLTGTVSLGPRAGAPVVLRVVAAGPERALRGRRTVAGARAALRAGRLRVLGGETDRPVGGTVAASVRRGDAPTACRDERAVDLPPLVLDTRGRAAVLTLGSRAYATEGDVLRTRCAGPARVAGGVPGPVGPLAAATLTPGALGGPVVTATLRPSVPVGWPFTAATRGELTVRLRRASTHVRIARVPG